MNQGLKKNLDIIQKYQDALKKEFNIKSIGIFGSSARGAQTKKSDIDIIVEFKEPIGFFQFLELEDYLSKILKKRVDLTTKKALKPAIKKSMLREVVYV